MRNTSDLFAAPVPTAASTTALHAAASAKDTAAQTQQPNQKHHHSGEGAESAVAPHLTAEQQQHTSASSRRQSTAGLSVDAFTTPFSHSSSASTPFGVGTPTAHALGLAVTHQHSDDANAVHDQGTAIPSSTPTIPNGTANGGASQQPHPHAQMTRAIPSVTISVPSANGSGSSNAAPWLPFCEDVGEMINDNRAWCIAGDLAGFAKQQLRSAVAVAARAATAAAGDSTSAVSDASEGPAAVSGEDAFAEQFVALLCAAVDEVFAAVPFAAPAVGGSGGDRPAGGSSGGHLSAFCSGVNSNNNNTNSNSVPPLPPIVAPTPASTSLKVTFSSSESFETFKGCAAVHGRPFVLCSFDCDNDASYVCPEPFFSRLAHFIADEQCRAHLSASAATTPAAVLSPSGDDNATSPHLTALPTPSSAAYGGFSSPLAIPCALLAPLVSFVESVVRGTAVKACQGQAPPAHLRPCETLGLTGALRAVSSTYRPLVYEPLCDTVTVVFSTRCPCCPDVIWMVDRIVAIINRHRARAAGEAPWDPVWSDLHCRPQCAEAAKAAIAAAAPSPASAAANVAGASSPTAASPCPFAGTERCPYRAAAAAAAAAGGGGAADGGAADPSRNLNEFSFGDDNVRGDTDGSDIASAASTAVVGHSSQSAGPTCPCDLPCIDADGRVSSRMRLVLCNIDEDDLGAADWPTNPSDQIVPHIRVYPATDLRARAKPVALPKGGLPFNNDALLGGEAPSAASGLRPLSRRCPLEPIRALMEASAGAGTGGGSFLVGSPSAAYPTGGGGAPQQKKPCLPMGSREFYEFLREADARNFSAAKNGGSSARHTAAVAESQNDNAGSTDATSSSPPPSGSTSVAAADAASYYYQKTGIPFGLASEDRSAVNVAKFILSHARRTVLSAEGPLSSSLVADAAPTSYLIAGNGSPHPHGLSAHGHHPHGSLAAVLAECRELDERMICRKKRARSDANIAASPSSSALDQKYL